MGVRVTYRSVPRVESSELTKYGEFLLCLSFCTIEDFNHFPKQTSVLLTMEGVNTAVLTMSASVGLDTGCKQMEKTA